MIGESWENRNHVKKKAAYLKKERTDREDWQRQKIECRFDFFKSHFDVSSFTQTFFRKTEKVKIQFHRKLSLLHNIRHVCGKLYLAAKYAKQSILNWFQSVLIEVI